MRALGRRKELAAGLTVREAEDRVHALMSPEVYRLFVVDRGWSAERYRQWLATHRSPSNCSDPVLPQGCVTRRVYAVR